MSDLSDVQRIVLALPETFTENGGFRVKNKPIAWTYMERVELKGPRVPRPDVLAVRIEGEGEKQFLLASDPTKFFTTPHYNNYPAILVRLPEVDVNEIAELLTDAWRLQAPKTLVKKYDAEQAQK